MEGTKQTRFGLNRRVTPPWMRGASLTLHVGTRGCAVMLFKTQTDQRKTTCNEFSLFFSTEKTRGKEGREEGGKDGGRRECFFAAGFPATNTSAHRRKTLSLTCDCLAPICPRSTGTRRWVLGEGLQWVTCPVQSCPSWHLRSSVHLLERSFCQSERGGGVNPGHVTSKLTENQTVTPFLTTTRVVSPSHRAPR